MELSTITIIYFFYGLAFFSMGFAIILESDRTSDERLRRAFRPLAAFGIIHGAHEWLEMFLGLYHFGTGHTLTLVTEVLRVAILAFSFLTLAAFGVILLSGDQRSRRLNFLILIIMVAVWGFGMFTLRNQYSEHEFIWDIADVWTRYSLAIPAALLAAAGLIVQQRRYRQAGMTQFGRDTLWAAIAFLWYGLIGQVFTRSTRLPPSDMINQELFFAIFGFPVQLVRASAAVVAAIFVVRFMRSFEVERTRQIEELQRSRLEEAEKREELRGELLRRIVAAQEAERQRIARELHDETGQALTGIGLRLRAISTQLEQDVDKSARQLHKLEDLVTQSIDELQRIISDLRPSHLDDLGLPAALRWYAGSIEHRNPLEIVVEVSGEERELSSPLKTGIFRIAQEAITNIVKHAHAKSVLVCLYYGSENLTLEVIDDGVGFARETVSIWGGLHSLGLLGMEERATDLGGRVLIESVLGEGTRVSFSIPIDRDQRSEDQDASDFG